MGYIQDLEKELREKLPKMDKETLVKYFKDKVWESYKNGVEAGKKGKDNKKFTKTGSSSKANLA